MFDLERIANAEYMLDCVGGTSETTRFGVFTSKHSHQDRANATQLVQARCGIGEVPALLDYLNRQYGSLGLKHCMISGCDPATLAILMPELRARGFRWEIYWALVKALPSERKRNALIDFRMDEPGANPDALAVHSALRNDLPGVQYIQEMSRHLRGKEVVAYLNNRPAGVGGWYVYQGVTRFTLLGTSPEFRRRGVATTLIEYILERPEVCDTLPVLCCDERGPLRLYEQLGFVRRYVFWIFYYPTYAQRAV